MDISKARIGFEYTFECFTAQGELKWSETVRNLIPNEGRDYILRAGMLAGPQFGAWYIGLYEGAYTPAVADTMATFAAAATEVTTYSEAARVALTPDVLTGGLYVNGASPAIFTFTANKTIRGGFISSGSVKGGTTGVLLSAVLASSPKTIASGEVLKVIAGLSLVTI